MEKKNLYLFNYFAIFVKIDFKFYDLSFSNMKRGTILFSLKRSFFIKIVITRSLTGKKINICIKILNLNFKFKFYSKFLKILFIKKI